MKKNLLILAFIITLTLSACGQNKKIEVPEKITENTSENIKLETNQNTIESNSSTIEKAISTTSNSAETIIAKDIILEIPNDDASGFTQIDGSLIVSDKEEIELIIEGLKASNVLNENCNMNEFRLDDNIMYLDMNDSFKDLICSQGTTGEYMIMGSLVNSILDTYKNIEYVNITVNETILVSGHVEYTEKMGRYK